MDKLSKRDWCPMQCNIEPYIAPTWAQLLPNIPQSRLRLAHLPTPVHKWDIPGVPDGFKVFIKRDDLTGSVGSGNKVRKLEFILAEAKRQGCKHVITVGGINSNHCRSTSVACAQAGLECHLILAAGNKTPDEIPSTGNMLLNKLCGANIYLIPNKYPDQALWPPQLQLAEKISANTGGEKSYIMPLGGSDTTGSFGYIEAYNEMSKQGVLDNITDIVTACGSGGTLSGLAVANHLAGNSEKIRLHGVRVSDSYSKQYFHEHCNEVLKHFQIDVKSEDIVNVVEGYIGQGYGKTTDKDLDLIKQTAHKTGIILDPTYTAKAAQAMVTEMQKNPTIFEGNRILFIHTGGIFGAMDHQELIHSLDNNFENKICSLSEYVNM